jgi:hypothetical protein
VIGTYYERMQIEKHFKELKQVLHWERYNKLRRKNTWKDDSVGGGTLELTRFCAKPDIEPCQVDGC